MNKELNLAPMLELLTTGIPARQLAEELDELMFDYTQCVLRLHCRGDENFINEKAPDFIFYLRELRDVILECTGND